MKLDTVLPITDYRSVEALAKHAEALGFAALWAPETTHTPFTPLVLAGMHTSQIELGTAIAVAFPRSPMITAMDSWEVQRVSGGRFILGLGTQVKGHNERRFSVPFDHPGPRMREMVQALRHIWKAFQGEERLSWKGDFYRFDLITPFFNPGPIANPEIPIYVAGVNEYMCKMAGELCDGFHIHPFHSIKYLTESVLPAIEEGLAASGRTRDDITLVAPVFVCLGNTEEEAEAAKFAVRAQISFYGSTRTYQPVFAAHGWEDATAELQQLMAQGKMGDMAAVITDEMLDEYALVATYDNVAEKVKAKYDGIADRVFFYMPMPPEGDAALEARWRPIIEAFNG